MNWRTLHLMLATPCFGGMVTQRYMKSTMELLLHGVRSGLAVTVELLGNESLIPRGRNVLVAKFLDHPAATHLLFVDADIGFEVAQVLRMLAFDEDVVAGMYPLKLLEWDVAARARAGAGEPLETACLRYLGVPCEGAARQEREGFVTAEYAGTGFMLLRRAALQRMIAAYPETRYAFAHTAAAPSASANQYALFDCMIEPQTRHYLSEDYAFCHRWREIGGRIWLDTQGALEHVGAHGFAGRPDLRFPLAPEAAAA
jgi:hypothetical protein